MDILLPYLSTIILTAIVLFSCYQLRRSKSSKTKLAPEAGGAWPIIGHLPLLAGAELPHLRLGALADKYGPIFTIRIGMYPAVVVSSWELAKELFTTNDAIVSSRSKLTASKILGYNFASFGFSPYGEFWRGIRKIVASELLSNRRLELLKHVRASEVEVSVKELYKLWYSKDKNVDSQILVNMNQWTADMNLNVMLRMIAGKRYYDAGIVTEENEARRCQRAMREFFHLTGLFVLRDAVPFLGWLDWGGYEKAMKRNAEELDNIFDEWLEEHRRKRDSGESANKEQDFIDVMLYALDGINLAGYDPDTVRKATSLSLIIGGTDTVTVTITWALSLLLNNTVALKNAQEELDVHVGKERLVNESDIEKLTYLQACVKEALRLYPAGPLGGFREFTADCTIGGYYVPAGTRLLLNIHKIQRDPRVWPNPTEFNPERLLGSHKAVDVKGQHFELIPFGAGRRACPGATLGLRMSHLVLASILQAFEISPPSNAPIDMTGTAGLTCSQATPLQVLVKPRLPASVYE
ncbi:cytochrome P450 CYP82D47-like [Populus alba x Populus x berolinensis]|nr:cytochrome P450 CYP82D47-like [Populus alba x Populus x berolinensis]